MSRRFAHAAGDYRSLLIETANEEGFDVVVKDGVAYMRVTVPDENGGESVTEVNLTRFAVTMARTLS